MLNWCSLNWVVTPFATGHRNIAMNWRKCVRVRAKSCNNFTVAIIIIIIIILNKLINKMFGPEIELQFLFIIMAPYLISSLCEKFLFKM